MVVDRGVSWETAVQVYEQHLSDHGASESSTAGRGQSGFYCSRREQYHRHLYILALQKENSTHLFNIIRFINPRSACVTVTVVFLSAALSGDHHRVRTSSSSRVQAATHGYFGESASRSIGIL